MNARLMKYIASHRPTVVKKIVNRRLCASGCRETPLMVALPARPSPIAAPMAPPPSRRPPPMNAPAASIAFPMSVAATWPSLPIAVRALHIFGLHGEAKGENGQQGEDACLDQADKH